MSFKSSEQSLVASLARIARRMRDPGTVAKLRASDDASALYTLLTQQMASNAA